MLTIDFSEGLTPYLERILDAAAAVVPDLEGTTYIIGRELPGMRGLSIAGLDQQFPEQGLLATRGGAVGEELGEYRYVWPTEVPRNTG
jgi:hypothetical protein